jgi:hypothetical protein
MTYSQTNNAKGNNVEKWTFTHNGRSFEATVERDDSQDTPWDSEDGHGPVTGWETRDKRPGELVLASHRRGRRFYDFQEACRIARKDGWDAPPYKTGTARQRAARAAMADFEYLRGWCNDDWCYVGVIVRPLCACCGTPDDSRAESLWGIESNAGDYLKEVAFELADQIAFEAVAA